MTLITKPVLPESEVLNHVARDLLVQGDDPNVIALKNAFKVVTEDGVIHDITFNQIDGLINILDRSREVPPITPLQYLITAYDLQDMLIMGKDGWAVSEYTVVVFHRTKTVRFEGTLTKDGCVDKVFTWALQGFDFIQQFSLSRIISNQHAQLVDVAGTFDMSYTFTYDTNGITMRPHEEGEVNEG